MNAFAVTGHYYVYWNKQLKSLKEIKAVVDVLIPYYEAKKLKNKRGEKL